MYYCRDCVYWTRHSEKWGTCSKALNGTWFRNYTKRGSYMAKHTNARYHGQQACKVRFEKKDDIMTRKEAIKYLEGKRKELSENGVSSDSDDIQVIKIAIGTLKKAEMEFNGAGCGVWKKFDDTLWECSECGELQYACTNYCSNCGSIMYDKRKPQVVGESIMYIGEKYKP